ncbi:hypothetical protein LTR50_004605 [Elasticomyces elasticus]|nr:hypothetical protein LTR50_004605 [Elasticomyces elasticus]
MPVKWSPDTDQLLLLLILKTHSISVDAKKVADAWPNDRGEKPSARAVTERLVKIRNLARASGGEDFSIGGKGGSKPSTPSMPSTPNKTWTPSKQMKSSASAAKDTPSKKTPSKRVKAQVDSDDDEDNINCIPLAEMKSLNGTPASTSHRAGDGNFVDLMEEDDHVGLAESTAPRKYGNRSAAKRARLQATTKQEQLDSDEEGVNGYGEEDEGYGEEDDGNYEDELFKA